MQVLEDYRALEGKTIAFTNMAQFAEQIVIATTDGCILMATFDFGDDEDAEIRVLQKRRVLGILESDRGRYLREQLSKRNLFDLQAYKQREEERAAKQREERQAERELKEYAEYERLKAKYEGDGQ